MLSLHHCHTMTLAAALTLPLILGGCATNANYPWDRWKAQKELEAAAAANLAPVPPSRFEEDRQAILAMAGDYHVTFAHRETVPFKPGYALRKPSVTEADATMRVIANDERMISLELTLLAKGAVVERWREDWVHEPKVIASYRGSGRWETRELNAAERRGRWRRTLYDADGALRHAALGAWAHENGLSSWTSAAAWQPVPHREAARRDDYDALLAMDRLTLTPSGFVHEEDNTKLVLRGGGSARALAREAGLSTYIRTARTGATAAAQ